MPIPGPFEQIFTRLGRRLDTDAGLRSDMNALFALLSSRTAPADVNLPVPDVLSVPSEVVLPVVQKPDEAEQDADSVPEGAEPEVATVEQVPHEKLITLLEGFGMVAPAPTHKTPSQTFAGPTVILQRLALKHEAARLALEHIEKDAAGEFQPPWKQLFAGLIDKARKQPNCYLWMCHRMHANKEAAAWRALLNCLQAMQRALNLVQTLLKDSAHEEKLAVALAMLAEAKSVLFIIAQEGFGVSDADAYDTHEFICDTGYDRRVFVQRHMTADDAADPAQVPALLDRIAEMEYAVNQEKETLARRKQLLNQARYEIKKACDVPEEGASHWSKVMETVSALLDAGVPPSNVELRGLLLPVLDQLPDEEHVPSNEAFRRVLREIDAHEAQREQTSLPVQAAPPVVTAEVERVRAALKDGVVVIIGGDCRHESRRSIMRAFQLKELNWIVTRPHETSTQFESAVAREDVRAVLLAIRWSSHSYGDVKTFCDRYNKPLVRLPRGYGINQIAHDICQQML